MKKEIVCSNCGSKSVNKITLGVIGSVVLIIQLLSSIFVLPLIFAKYTIPFSIICILLSPFIKHIYCTCRTCKYNWSDTKK